MVEDGAAAFPHKHAVPVAFGWGAAHHRMSILAVIDAGEHHWLICRGSADQASVDIDCIAVNLQLDHFSWANRPGSPNRHLSTILEDPIQAVAGAQLNGPHQFARHVDAVVCVAGTGIVRDAQYTGVAVCRISAYLNGITGAIVNHVIADLW